MEAVPNSGILSELSIERCQLYISKEQCGGDMFSRKDTFILGAV